MRSSINAPFESMSLVSCRDSVPFVRSSCFLSVSFLFPRSFLSLLSNLSSSYGTERFTAPPSLLWGLFPAVCNKSQTISSRRTAPCICVATYKHQSARRQIPGFHSRTTSFSRPSTSPYIPRKPVDVPLVSQTVTVIFPPTPTFPRCVIRSHILVPCMFRCRRIFAISGRGRSDD